MTTLFSAVLIMAIAIAVALFAILIDNELTQKRRTKLLSAFSDAATGFNLSISKMELLGSRAIGLDDETNRLLFLVLGKKKQEGYLVDLAEIESCTLEKKYAASSAQYIKRLGAEAFIDRVALDLRYKNGAKPLSLTFYEKAKDPVYEVRNRTEQAREWQSLLSGRLKKNDDGMGSEEGILHGHTRMAGV